jgi:phospho-N-acetylmuramoyl-pentapeptide-transferase
MEAEVNNVANAIKVFGLLAAAFVAAILWTPLLTKYLYKYQLWRKEVRTASPDGTKTPLFAALHKDRETKVPRLGGVLIWVTILVIASGVWLLAQATDIPFLDKANFFSRNQTWLPLFTLLAASLLGAADDLAQVWGKGKYVAGGIRFRHRLLVVFLIALAGAWWFYFKLDWRTIYIPGYGDLYLGLWYIPLFIGAMILLFSSSIVAGIDGLAGGVFGAAFAAYGGIAFFRGQIDLAAFAGVVLGAILAFLWFNIPPARFYMGESGIIGLTTSLTVVAFLTDSVVVLPVIGAILMVEVASDVIQFASKRLRGKKVFLIAPIHHHFEAIGWPPHKVTMRFWIISVVAAILGMAIALVGR